MNEEERKAIEILNTFELRRKTKKYKEISLEDSQSVEMLLNLIEKLQKENEKLKNKLLDTLEGQKVIEEETPQYIKENYISKEKIEDKVRELERYIQENSDDEGYFGDINPSIIYAQTTMLEEILKEEK